MATKKPAQPAAAAPFTIVQGALNLPFPATYVPDARLETFKDTDYPSLTKGRDLARTVDALLQVADVVEAEPDLITLPKGLTPDRLRQIARQLTAVAKAKAELDAAATVLSRLTQLDRDVAADATNEILDQVKSSARRNAAVKDRFNLLLDLNKKK